MHADDLFFNHLDDSLLDKIFELIENSDAHPVVYGALSCSFAYAYLIAHSVPDPVADEIQTTINRNLIHLKQQYEKE